MGRGDQAVDPGPIVRVVQRVAPQERPAAENDENPDRENYIYPPDVVPAVRAPAQEAACTATTEQVEASDMDAPQDDSEKRTTKVAGEEALERALRNPVAASESPEEVPP